MIDREQLMEFVRSDDTDETFGTLLTDDLYEIMVACCLYSADLEARILQAIQDHQCTQYAEDNDFDGL